MASGLVYELLVYTGAFRFVGWVGRPNSVLVTPRHNMMPTLSFTLDSDHGRVQDLIAPGARVVVFKGGKQILSGPVRLAEGTFDLASVLTFSVQGDFRVLHNWLAWPKPTAALTGQDVTYRTITGPAETVVKTIVRENAVRLGYPLTTAPDQGRGAVGTYTFRFHPMFDRLFPRVDAAGVGVDVQQVGTGLVLDCYTPRTYPHELSTEAGTITGGTYTIGAPNATRVVVGGQGEGVARVFKGFPDAAREAAWADKIEVFQDARDSSVGDVFAERANETLAEGAPMSGLSLELSETPNFKLDKDKLWVGDRVTASINGQLFTDTLRQATLAWGDSGELNTPVIGERNDDPAVTLAKRLRALTKDNKDRMAR